ncbi:MAG: hypothetical protein ABI995_03910 [Acidobacteriota bacterium]
MSHDPAYEHDVTKHDPKEGFDPTEPAASRITLFVVISVITLVVVIVALQRYFETVWTGAVYEKVLAAPGLELKDQRSLEAWRLTHYEYATPEKKTVRIPLDRARELVLQEAAQGKTFYPAKPTAPKSEEPPAAAGADKEAVENQEAAKK